MTITRMIVVASVAVATGYAGVIAASEPLGRPLTRQPASQASPGANKLSPPFGDYQAQGE